MCRAAVKQFHFFLLFFSELISTVRHSNTHSLAKKNMEVSFSEHNMGDLPYHNPSSSSPSLLAHWLHWLQLSLGLKWRWCFEIKLKSEMDKAKQRQRTFVITMVAWPCIAWDMSSLIWTHKKNSVAPAVKQSQCLFVQVCRKEVKLNEIVDLKNEIAFQM